MEREKQEKKSAKKAAKVSDHDHPGRGHSLATAAARPPPSASAYGNLSHYPALQTPFSVARPETALRYARAHKPHVRACSLNGFVVWSRDHPHLHPACRPIWRIACLGLNPVYSYCPPVPAVCFCV